MANISL